MKISLYQPLAIHELGARQNQEDSIYPLLNQAGTGDSLFLVCDGMGGHEHGEVASQTVCETLSKELSSHLEKGVALSDEMLNAALEKAWQQLDEKDSQSAKKMGTTLTLLCFHRGGCTLAHIGDSRIYHIRPSDSKILYKSRDHSLVFDLFRAGEISLEEMKTHPQKNVITRAMMPGKGSRVKADITHVADLQPDDYFYLCSDGMLEQMEDYELLTILAGSGGDEKKRQQLIAATMENSDNHSAYLVRIREVIGEPGDGQLRDDEQTVAWNVANLQPEIEQAEVVTVANNADVTISPKSQTVNPLPSKTPPAIITTPTENQTRRVQNTAGRAQPKSKKTSSRSLVLSALLVAAMVIGGFYLFNKNKAVETPEPTIDEVMDVPRPATQAGQNNSGQQGKTQVDVDVKVKRKPSGKIGVETNVDVRDEKKNEQERSPLNREDKKPQNDFGKKNDDSQEKDSETTGQSSDNKETPNAIKDAEIKKGETKKTEKTEENKDDKEKRIKEKILKEKDKKSPRQQP